MRVELLDIDAFKSSVNGLEMPNIFINNTLECF